MDIKIDMCCWCKMCETGLVSFVSVFFPSPVQSPHNLGWRVSQGAGWPHFLLLSMGNFHFGAWFSALLLLFLLLVPLTLTGHLGKSHNKPRQRCKYFLNVYLLTIQWGLCIWNVWKHVSETGLFSSIVMQWCLECMCSLMYVMKLNVDISVYLLWGCVVLYIKLQALVLFNISPQAWWSGRRWSFETSLVLTLHNYWVWFEGWDGSVVTVQHLKQTWNSQIYKNGAMTLMTMIFW